jgi:hypothetical protein
MVHDPTSYSGREEDSKSNCQRPGNHVAQSQGEHDVITRRGEIKKRAKRRGRRTVIRLQGYTALCGIALTAAVLRASDRDQRYADNAVLTSAAAQCRLPGRDCACLGSGDNNDLSIHLRQQVSHSGEASNHPRPSYLGHAPLYNSMCRGRK